MRCKQVQRTVSTMIDGVLPRPQRAQVSEHLSGCSACEGLSEDYRDLRSTLRRLPKSAASERLNLQLRVLASHDRARRIAGETWWRQAAFKLRNFMRPVMVPAAGGLLSSVALFAILAGNLEFRGKFRNDQPLRLYTAVRIETASPFACYGKDVLVELTIDEKGNVANYNSPTGSLTRDDMKEIGNMVLFTSFSPATAYGQPVTGKVLVSLRHINVRG